MRFTLVVLLGLICGVRSGIFNAGPYNLKLVRHELCEDQGTGEGVQDLRFTKKSTHKSYIEGKVVVPMDYDENVHGHLNFSRRGSRGWGLNAYRVDYDYFCKEFLQKSPNLFNYYFKALGIENPSCPIKAGNYSLLLDTDIPRLRNFPMLPYGTYRVAQFLTYGNPPVRLGCSAWYVTCTERPRT